MVIMFLIICRDYTDYAFYLPGGAGIRTGTAIMTKKTWNPPKKISETLPVQWGANEFGEAFDLETSVSFQERVVIYNHQLLGLSYMTGAFMLTIHTYCFCSYSWWLYSIQIFKTIVNVLKTHHLRCCKDFFDWEYPSCFHTIAVLQGHFWLWMLCLKLQESKSFTWCQVCCSSVGTTNFIGFYEIHPGSDVLLNFFSTCLPIYPKNCH